jgi:hypothetical protein
MDLNDTQLLVEHWTTSPRSLIELFFLKVGVVFYEAPSTTLGRNIQLCFRLRGFPFGICESNPAAIDVIIKYVMVSEAGKFDRLI